MFADAVGAQAVAPTPAAITDAAALAAARSQQPAQLQCLFQEKLMVTILNSIAVLEVH